MDLFRKKTIHNAAIHEGSLHRCLSAYDLIFMGIGAILGAGIFVITGVVAATQAGPAIVFSYVIAGIACGFAALSYAELAALVGGCGSAYGYAYAGFGELIAWIVGWDLLLEYTISISAVSVGWSGYCNDLLLAMHIHIPTVFLHSPAHAHSIANLLAVFIIVVLAALLILGIKFSTHVNNAVVFIKLSVIILFIAIASFQFKFKNWAVFMPFGWMGVVKGASLIFFAYIGFDAVSTAAEEAQKPQRDVPVGVIGSLLACTILYIVMSALLTGIVPYQSLNVASPISHALLAIGHPVAAGVIVIGALAGLTTVMLVFYYGLTRVFFAMARDGLLPKSCAVIDTRTRTPIRVIVLCGIVIALFAAFLPIDDLAELVNIGTLFAFIIVCIGVIVLRYTRPDAVRPFKTPFAPVTPLLGIISCAYLIGNLPWITILRFVIWMVLGLIVYFLYSRTHSIMHKSEAHNR